MTEEELKKEAEEYLTQFYCLKQCYDIAIRECKNGERIRCDYFEVRLNCLTSFAEQVTKELQEENVELIGKVAFLENDLNNVKAQIEKMKRDVFECFGSEYNLLVAKLFTEWEIKEK